MYHRLVLNEYHLEVQLHHQALQFVGRKLAILLVAKVQIQLDLDKLGDWVENVLHHQHQHLLRH